MYYMTKIKSVAIFLVFLLLAMIVASFVVGSLINMVLPPTETQYSDEIVEDIGGDNVLTATLKHCLKIKEENIPDNDFKTHLGQQMHWKNAKSITYLDNYGNRGNMIVWKTDSNEYSDVLNNPNGSYISDSLDSMKGQFFIVNYPDKNAAYGIIVSTENITCPESVLLYDILGLDSAQFTPTYSTGSGYSSYSGGSSHYHTVVPDRYTLSRTDPGAYYDHYEYGDNYDIDDYLESQGYD